MDVFGANHEQCPYPTMASFYKHYPTYSMETRAKINLEMDVFGANSEQCPYHTMASFYKHYPTYSKETRAKINLKKEIDANPEQCPYHNTCIKVVRTLS